MNADELQTEKIVEDMYNEINQKYPLKEKKELHMPHIPHIPYMKFGIWLVLFLFFMLMTQYMLPVPDVPAHEENIFNGLFLYSSFAWLMYIPFILGFELGKKRRKEE